MGVANVACNHARCQTGSISASIIMLRMPAMRGDTAPPRAWRWHRARRQKKSICA